MSKKLVALLVSIVLIFGLGAGVYAGSNLQEIQAYLNGDVKFALNGSDWRPKDENGNEQLPITYNGSTYVPLRAVSNALQTPVDYDAASNTVILGERKEGVTLNTNKIQYKYGGTSGYGDTLDKSELVFGGKQFNNGAFWFEDSKYNNYYMIVDFGKKYSKMHLIMAAKEDVTIEVQNQDKQGLTKFELSADHVGEVDVDLQSASGIRVFAYGKDGQKRVYILKDSYLK